ncbi:MAG TPA: ABC transporter substrate-binding protein [Burkholderiales bacterium]|nr:ABC transporter substrate-binding protein [Burkholderiales bacterium]
MWRMIERVALFVLGALLVAPATGAAAEVAPDVLVKKVTLEVLDIVKRDRDIQAGDHKKIIALVEEKVLPHFDFETMTRIAMGRNWRQASPEQKKRLVVEFKTLLVRTYSSAISNYQDEKFEFQPLRAAPDATDVTVNVRVIQPGREAVRIDYDMENTPDGWKCYNVYVAGVSLVANYRTEFDAEVRRNGVEGLLKSLEAKNKSLEHAPIAGKK